ncbi:MAG TPA: ABC transporter permease [Thermoanaerobaculia bacterium]
MRLVRLALRVLPRSFRDEHGRELEAALALRLARGGGPFVRAAAVARELGGLLATAARVHAELMRQDLRWALRTLRRSPGFAVTAVAVGALGIGATTAAVSVTDHVLVRKLPFADSGRLVKLWQTDPRRGYSRLEASPAHYREWRQLSRSFDSLAAYWPSTVTLVGAGEPERLEAAQVSASLADVLRVRPALGRLFDTSDDVPGAPATVVLAHAYWSSRFAGDREIVGRTLRLDGETATVVGVLPAGLHFPERTTQVWTPQRFAPEWYEDRTNTFLRVVARLAPGVSLVTARGELAAIAAQKAREFPNPAGDAGVAVIGLRDELSRESRLLLVALSAAALCLLLLSTTNLANLLLARSLARSRELAVRSALGGGRARLVRQMLTESLALAFLSGGLGVALAYAATPAVARLVPSSLPIAEAPAIDLRLLLVATLVTIATGVGFGLAPALRAPADASADELREGSRAALGGRRERWRRALVFAEVALSVALLVSTGLLLRALGRLQGTDPGFRSGGVVTLRTWLPRPEYDATEKRHQFYGAVLDEVRALPGVESAGYITFLPMTMRGGIWGVKSAGATDADAEIGTASLRYTTPQLFATLGMRLVAGRDVSPADTLETEKVAVVSESFARQYLAEREPLGQRFQIAFFERTVVGVVADVAVRGLGKLSEPQVYLPHRQIPDGWMIIYDPKDLAVRTTGSFEPLVPELRRIVARADPNLPITSVQPLAAIVDADTAPRAAQLRVLGAFAAVAVLLAATGLHGLLAYAVASRRQEIGVRMALGAGAREVVALVVRQALAPAAGGAAVGLVLAAAAGRALGALLAGVSPLDGVAYGASLGVVAAMALAGSALPAWRAVRLDPTTALRAE